MASPGWLLHHEEFQAPFPHLYFPPIWCYCSCSRGSLGTLEETEALVQVEDLVEGSDSPLAERGKKEGEWKGPVWFAKE